jgi:hypothetical protein
MGWPFVTLKSTNIQTEPVTANTTHETQLIRRAE